MFNIVGAGMAGLVAGCVLDQNKKLFGIYEKNNELPNNHSALLRFRSSIVGDTVGIPFRQVDVIKSIHSDHKTKVAQSLAYSVKTNGSATLRSVLSAEDKKEKRFISPPDFISKMAERFDESVLKLGRDVSDMIKGNSKHEVSVISTIPMQARASILEYDGFKKSEFQSAKGWSLRVGLSDVDVCATIYFPDDEEFYRASITDSTLIVEYCNPTKSAIKEDVMKSIIDHPSEQKEQIEQVLSAFGLSFNHVTGKPTISETRYAKILPIDEDERRRFIMWATDEHGIYSLGRFATWRPGLMTDDLIQDVRLIEKMANKSDYEKRK